MRDAALSHTTCPFPVDGIAFSSRIPSGNGHTFTKVGSDTFRFHIQNDGEPFAQYFHIEIRSDTLPRRMRLQVADGVAWGKPASPYTWYKPVTSNDGGMSWTTPDMTAILLSEGSAIGDQMVEYAFTLNDSPIRFASVIPHTLPDLARWLAGLARSSHVQVGTCGRTAQGREIPSIYLTNRAIPDNGKARIFIMAGQHPAETEPRYVIQYMVDAIVASPHLFDHLEFKIVPMVNVDGVELGRSYTNVHNVNLSTSWSDLTQAEIEALRTEITRFRPHLFVDLHSGAFPFVSRIHYAMDESNRQMLEEAIAGALRELPFGHMQPAADRSVDVLRRQGLVTSGFIFEVSRLPNDLAWYRRQSHEILNLITNYATQLALNNINPVQKPKAYKFSLGDFAERLPSFYYTHDINCVGNEIINFEVNGITLPSGQYDLYLEQVEPDSIIKASLDGYNWTDVRQECGAQPVIPSYHLSNERITMHLLTTGTGIPLPAGAVTLIPSGRQLHECEPVLFTDYRRDTGLHQRPLYQDWQHSLQVIKEINVDITGLRTMLDSMVRYSASKQVLDESDLHYGAIYSDEDKYSFRDAACAATAFMQRFNETRALEWKQRARIALNYAYQGQQFQADPEVLGGISEMRALGSKRLYNRIDQTPSLISGVDTGIIACHAVQALQLGLDITEKDIDALKYIATWFINNEYRLCQLRHHQGATTDCQNSNAIGAAALTYIGQFLKEQNVHVPDSWRVVARRTLLHVLDGQEAIGVWPYIFAKIGRGQRYHWQSIPDQGMLLHHLLLCRVDEEFATLINGSGCMPRIAYWYLLTSRQEGENGITLDYEHDPGTRLGFSGFTWCRFMACAAISNIWNQIGNTDFWRSFVLNQLGFIYKQLYVPDTGRAPIKGSVVPLSLHSWIQALEWDAVLLHDTLANLQSGMSG